ncbi:AraC family transcriptional regulator [Actinoplanes sp. TBRC 11911]|uniref:AraC family transcriptional regulator n=1 Tax=Actinoplanes sp. TBRC 11911 TaxID=2729386 RepID=UPI00145D4FF6|nr:AraC family transcriptional regulator [Actinoplanes sp. TBRC 11911]NMO56139.1 AraC family transcriptional regulator [Actinoplanes sp. TBRC 11911]
MPSGLLSDGELDQLSRDCFIPVIPFVGEGSTVQMTEQDLSDSVGLMRLSTTGSFRSVRTARLAAQSTGSEMMLLSVGLNGDFRVRQNGKAAWLTVGDAVLYQARDEWELETRGNSRSQLIKFSRDLLPPRTRDIRETGPGLDSGAPAMTLFARYLDQLDSCAAGLTPLQRADAGHAAIALLNMALRGTEPAGPDGSDPVLLEMLQAYVRDHLAGPLTVEDLARAHHISVRQVYHLFELADMTPGVYIRTRRLRAARDLLADPTSLRLSIRRVAAMTGFPNVRTFHRAFQQEFGTTPDSWRHHGKAPEPPRRQPGVVG